MRIKTGVVVGAMALTLTTTAWTQEVPTALPVLPPPPPIVVDIPALPTLPTLPGLPEMPDLSACTIVIRTAVQEQVDAVRQLTQTQIEQLLQQQQVGREALEAGLGSLEPALRARILAWVGETFQPAPAPVPAP